MNATTQTTAPVTNPDDIILVLPPMKHTKERMFPKSDAQDVARFQARIRREFRGAK